MLTRRVAVSSGGMACSAPAVTQPALELIPWVTPTRNDAVDPAASTSGASGADPKKSWVVRVLRVGSGAPDRLRNRTPGNPKVWQLWALVFLSAKPSSPWPAAPC